MQPLNTKHFIMALVCPISVRIIVWNSLCNKYVKCSEAFSLPEAVFFKNCEAFFLLCHVVLGIKIFFFDNSLQCMNKSEYNVDMWQCGWIKFSLGRNFIFCMIYNITIAITRIHFAICKVWSDNSNTVYIPLQVNLHTFNRNLSYSTIFEN